MTATTATMVRTRRAAPGEQVRITYDTHEEVDAGDALVALSGRTYLVLEARRVTRGKHVGHRWRLELLVAEPPVPAGVRVHTLVWNPRKRRRAPA